MFYLLRISELHQKPIFKTTFRWKPLHLKQYGSFQFQKRKSNDVYIIQRCPNNHTLISLEYNIIVSYVLFLFSYHMFLLRANNKLIVKHHYL
jgi:hypothetical protein